MDLLGRYLQAVRPLLLRKGREDILRELSENIVSQMEELEEDLGRPLTTAEQEDVIKRHGHPVVAAARYGRRQYLIGPELFPFYWLVLRIAGAGALIVRGVVAVVLVLSSGNPSEQIGRAMVEVPFVLVPVFCWITGAFAVLELCLPYIKISGQGSWDVRSLPSFEPRTSSIPRQNSMAEIIFGTAAILWWQAVPVAPFLALGPAAGFLQLGPIWTTLHWPILLLTVASVVQSWVNLFLPEMTAPRALVRLITHAAGVVTLGVLLWAKNWVIIHPGMPEAAGVVHVVNRVLLPCFATGLLIAVALFAWECVRYFRRSLLSSGLACYASY